MVRVLFLTAATLVIAAATALAQQPGGAKPKAKPPAKTAPAKPGVPPAVQILNHIRSTILALNHANLTGNYTVVLDLGTPDFQRSNNAATLAETFRDLRVGGLDLNPVATITPKLVREPAIDSNGFLRLTGFFPSRPAQVNFDIALKYVDDRWRLAGLSVSASSVAASGSAGENAPSPKPVPPVSNNTSGAAPPTSDVKKKGSQSPPARKSKP